MVSMYMYTYTVSMYAYVYNTVAESGTTIIRMLLGQKALVLVSEIVMYTNSVFGASPKSMCPAVSNVSHFL